MVDFIKGAKLTSVELAIEGDAHCPLCGASTSSVEIPIIVQSSIPMPPGQVSVFLRTGTPILNTCGHELPAVSRVVASIRDDGQSTCGNYSKPGIGGVLGPCVKAPNHDVWHLDARGAAWDPAIDANRGQDV